MQKFKIPHAFIFLFGIIVCCSIMSYFIPSGSFERTTKAYGNRTQTVILPGTHTEIPKHYSFKATFVGEKVEGKASPISLLGIFSAIPKGLADSAALIFYVFIIGAVITLIHHTGAINAVIFSLIAKYRERPKKLFLFIYMLFFTAASFMGIAASTIALIPVFLFLSKRMGYDQMFGLGLVVVPILLGWSTGVTNPFTVQIAQRIAELPIGSGIELRMLLFVVCAAIGFYFLMSYGNRVKKNPAASLVKNDFFDLSEYGKFEETKLERKHKLILAFFVTSFAAIIFAVQTIGWGLIEMSACFLFVTLIVTMISGMSGDESMAAFVKGLQIMIVPALLVGVARGISVVLQEGLIIDTLLHEASAILITLPQIVAGEGMFLFQSLLNFLIPSASGQALVSMPIMTPLADLLGISRQTAVLAFILGDGLSNIIIPTNGVLLAMLAIAKIPFGKWLKFAFPLFLANMIVAMVFIALAIMIGY